MIDDIIKEATKKMAGAIDFARQDFASVRTGRANPAMFNKLEADYYGVPTPLQQLATFQSPEPRVMLISPFDASALNAIEEAIRNSDLGVNPASDGKAIRVVLPELTEERRKEYIKLVRAKAEEGRVAVRNIRRDGMDQIKKAKAAGMPEDDQKMWHDEVQELTDKAIAAVDKTLQAKQAEIMQV